MQIAGTDRREGEPSENRHRRQALGGGSVAELTKHIVAPTIRGPGGGQAAAVPTPGVDAREAQPTGHENRGWPGGPRSITQLSEEVVAPAIRRLAGCHAAGVVDTDGHPGERETDEKWRTGHSREGRRGGRERVAPPRPIDAQVAERRDPVHGRDCGRPREHRAARIRRQRERHGRRRARHRAAEGVLHGHAHRRRDGRGSLDHGRRGCHESQLRRRSDHGKRVAHARNASLPRPKRVASSRPVNPEVGEGGHTVLDLHPGRPGKARARGGTRADLDLDVARPAHRVAGRIGHGDLQRRRNDGVRGDSRGRLDAEGELCGSTPDIPDRLCREWRRRIVVPACLGNEGERDEERQGDGTTHGRRARGRSRLRCVAIWMPLATLSARVAWCCGSSTI